jgi:hypothetical protein
MTTPICSRRRNNVDILGQDGGRGSAPNGQGKRLKCCSNGGAELHLRVVVGDAMTGAKNQAVLPGRVPHVCPGVHGRNKTGRSPFQRSCYVGNETAAKIKNPRTWSESIGRIRFRRRMPGEHWAPVQARGLRPCSVRNAGDGRHLGAHKISNSDVYFRLWPASFPICPEAVPFERP